MSSLTSNQQIRYGALLSYAGIILYILIGLLYTPWMIRCIGQADFGLYTLAYSIISFFVFDFGISAAIQRFIAKYLAENNYNKVNQCVSIIVRLYIIIDVFIIATLICVYFLSPYIYRELMPEQLTKFKSIYIIASFFSIVSFPFIPLDGIVSAHEKFVPLKVCDLMSKVVTVISCVICLLLGKGLFALVLSNAIVGLVFILIKLVITAKTTSIKLNVGFHNNLELKNILTFSGWTMVVVVCQRCIFSIAPSILGYYQSASYIAVLGIAISLEAYNYTFAHALNGLFLPKISRILNNSGDILPLMIKVGRIQIFTLGLMIVGFALIGKCFIESWVGHDYSEAYICTLLFIIPAFLLLPADIADQTLIASNNVKYRAYVYISMAIINLLLVLLLTQHYGLIGLATSIFIAYMLRSIALYCVYYTILKINIFKFINETFVKMLPALVLSAISALIIISLVNLDGWIRVGVNGAIVCTIYLIIMSVFGLNASERSLIISPIKRLLKH